MNFKGKIIPKKQVSHISMYSYKYNILLKSILIIFDFILTEYILLYIYIPLCYNVYIYIYIGINK